MLLVDVFAFYFFNVAKCLANIDFEGWYDIEVNFEEAETRP